MCRGRVIPFGRLSPRRYLNTGLLSIDQMTKGEHAYRRLRGLSGVDLNPEPVPQLRYWRRWVYWKEKGNNQRRNFTPTQL